MHGIYTPCPEVPLMSPIMLPTHMVVCTADLPFTPHLVTDLVRPLESTEIQPIAESPFRSFHLDARLVMNPAHAEIVRGVRRGMRILRALSGRRRGVLPVSRLESAEQVG